MVEEAAGASADAADLRELGQSAVWSLSSAKPGNGVDQLRDGSAETYWQSDGLQPHLINVQFLRNVSVAEVALFLDYKLDESYTPRKVAIRSGDTHHDLAEVGTVETSEPQGWVRIPVADPSAVAAAAAAGADVPPLRTRFVQVAILGMHQNGRDTHVRQVRIYGPRETTRGPLGASDAFTSPEFQMYGELR